MASTMDSRAGSRSEVMEAQAPLRDRYPSHPDDAISIKSARTSGVGRAPWRGKVEIGDGHGVSVEFVADEKVGGPGDAPNPPDIMCASVAACEHLTVQMVADLMGVELRELEVEVSGEVDTRGTLLISREAPIGFRSMRCDVRLRCAPGTDERRRRLLGEYAERSCVTLATVREGVAVDCRVDAS
jgi:uncharacterized OsmC-like protein